MNEIHHKILSDLHRILSFATSEQLASTSRSPNVSTHIKYALEALAKERELTADKKPTSQISKIKSHNTSEKSTSSTVHRLKTMHPLNDETRHLVHKVLNDSPRFAKKSDIVHFASSVGAQLEIRSKDNKKRVINKFMAALEKASRPQLSRVLRQVFSGQDKQTEGWIELITNSR